MYCNCLTDKFNCIKCQQKTCCMCDNKSRYISDFCYCETDVCWTCKHTRDNSIECYKDHGKDRCFSCKVCLDCLDKNKISHYPHH